MPHIMPKKVQKRINISVQFKEQHFINKENENEGEREDTL